jgi:proline racemase
MAIHGLGFPDAFSRMLEVVDSHTCGQPTRVVLSGHGIAAGTDPLTARADIMENRDWVRRTAVFEPRGHRSMFAVALIAPAAPGDEFGAVFMDALTYPDMCGHATIGVATTLMELGLVRPPEDGYSGSFEFGLKTPAGRMQLRATVDAGRCRSVAFTFEGAYFLGTVTLEIGGKTVDVDIAYAGQWYAYLPVSAVGLTVEAHNVDRLVAAAADVRGSLVPHLAQLVPDDERPPVVGNIVWIDAPTHELAAQRNIPISAAGSFDRSPCGTATCARIATLIAKSQLDPGQPFVNEGLLGTIYFGRALPDFRDAAGNTIAAEVEGSAWLTSIGRLIVDDRDPLANGYLA